MNLSTFENPWSHWGLGVFIESFEIEAREYFWYSRPFTFPKLPFGFCVRPSRSSKIEKLRARMHFVFPSIHFPKLTFGFCVRPKPKVGFEKWMYGNTKRLARSFLIFSERLGPTQKPKVSLGKWMEANAKYILAWSFCIFDERVLQTQKSNVGFPSFHFPKLTLGFCVRLSQPTSVFCVLPN